jgi:hypothetical protein
MLTVFFTHPIITPSIFLPRLLCDTFSHESINGKQKGEDEQRGGL